MDGDGLDLMPPLVPTHSVAVWESLLWALYLASCRCRRTLDLAARGSRLSQQGGLEWLASHRDSLLGISIAWMWGRFPVKVPKTSLHCRPHLECRFLRLAVNCSPWSTPGRLNNLLSQPSLMKLGIVAYAVYIFHQESTHCFTSHFRPGAKHQWLVVAGCDVAFLDYRDLAVCAYR